MRMPFRLSFVIDFATELGPPSAPATCDFKNFDKNPRASKFFGLTVTISSSRTRNATLFLSGLNVKKHDATQMCFAS